MKLFLKKLLFFLYVILLIISNYNFSFSNSSIIKLLMIDDTGCPYCELWEEEIGYKYSKTEEGRLAPLIRHHYGAILPSEIILNSEPIYTPTFILLQNNKEKYRFEGYLGEEFFWSFLNEYIDKIVRTKKK